MAFETASKAAEVILDIYYSRGDLLVEIKADQSPVTKADRAADQLIIQALRKHSSFPVVTEEQPLDIADRKDRKSVWLVDPLDGTQNFINRDGQFSVLICLLHLNQPAIGVVIAPDSQQSFRAYRGGGAWYAADGKVPIRVRQGYPKRPLQLVLSSLPSANGRLREEQFVTTNALQPHQVTRVGSALKLGNIAMGKFDATIRFDPLGEWDVAAADCILSEADCQMKDVLTNRPIAYNERDSLLLPGYMVSRADYEFIAQAQPDRTE